MTETRTASSPDRVLIGSVNSLNRELADAEEATGMQGPIATLTAVAFEVHVWLISHRDYMVSQPDGPHHHERAYFLANGQERASQSYARALAYASEQAVAALAAEES